jgi:hypothetical protein
MFPVTIMRLNLKLFFFLRSDFSKPRAEVIQTLEEVARDYQFGQYEDDHPGEEFPLCDAFWTASALLGRVKAETRRIFLFTCQDLPHTDEAQLQRARARLDDCAASGVEVELFAFDPPGGTFRLEPFYSCLRGLEDDENDDFEGDKMATWKAFARLEDMKARTKMKVRGVSLPQFIVFKHVYIFFLGHEKTYSGSCSNACC